MDLTPCMTLGIDLGTSELKLLLLDGAQGKVIDQLGEPLALQQPQPSWREQHPADWWAALQRAVQRMRQRQPQAWGRVRAIGLSGQMHGAVCLDAQQQVLRPAILWNDGRSEAACAELLRRVPDLHQRSGNLAMPGFTAPKLIWMQQHESELHQRTAHVLLPKDWLVLQLSGRLSSDPSDAAGTLWLDPARRDWDETLLAACGLSRAHMPQLHDGGAAVGPLRPELAAAWGLSPGVVIAAGAGDNAASAVGLGVVQPGQGFISLGTSGVVFLVTDRFAPAPQTAVHAFCHTVPNRWHQMSVMLSAAACLAWWNAVAGAPGEAVLVAESEALPPLERTRAPLFLPYLSGERTPHNDAHVRGSFHGLDTGHSRAALTWAVLEGVAFGLADGLDALRAAGGAPQTLGLVGGGARSALWAQLLADALQSPVEQLEGAQAAAALGAARLGALALGLPPAQVCQPLPVLRRFEPAAAAENSLAARRARWRRLYPPWAP
jgi:xylulokinase